jgi:hypothetical protein
MKLPRRFTLSVLLLVITAVAMLFGYAGWRKRQLVSEVAKLRQDGMTRISVSDDWFWPVPLSDGIVSFDKDKNGRFLADGKVLAQEELITRYAHFEGRLKALGVSPVTLELMVEKEMSGGGEIYFSMQFDTVEEFHHAMEEMKEQPEPQLA